MFKFNSELKLGKNRNKFGVENWKHGNLISGTRRKGLEEKSWVERAMLKESSLRSNFQFDSWILMIEWWVKPLNCLRNTEMQDS